MKTKILIAFFLMSTSLLTFSQSAKEQKLLDKLCKEACDEINKTDFKDSDDSKETEMKLGLALLPVISNNSKEIKSVWGLDVTKPDDARQVGEKLGASLVFKCDKFKKIALDLSAKSGGGSTESESDVETKSVRGSIDRIDCGDFCVVYFKTQTDETIRLYWMEKFSGSSILEKFTSSDGKSLKVIYTEKVIYQAKSKSYQTIKVIAGLE